MSRDKQIEEMADDIWYATDALKIGETEDVAKSLYAKGYRKASEVALKVIGEIEEATENHIKAISRLDPQNDYCAGGKKALDMTLKVLAELKKKYTESENNNGN